MEDQLATQLATAMTGAPASVYRTDGTAASTTFTVKSSDGFSETWTFGSPINVIEHRTTVQPSNVTTGETVGLAGTKSGSNLTATLMVIPNSK